MRSNVCVHGRGVPNVFVMARITSAGFRFLARKSRSTTKIATHHGGRATLTGPLLIMSSAIELTEADHTQATEGATSYVPLKELHEDVEDEETTAKKKCQRLIFNRTWQTISGASFVVNIVAMVIEKSAVMIVAGIVALLIAPYVIIRQFELQDEDCKWIHRKI